MFGGKLESVRIKKKICNINKVLKIGWNTRLAIGIIIIMMIVVKFINKIEFKVTK